MLEFIVNYLTVDAVASLFVGVIIYAKRNQIKYALRAWLAVPAGCSHPEEIEADDEFINDYDSEEE
jgi:hypothetical protein